MAQTHLSRAVQFICGNRKTTASQIASNAGLSHVILSRACSGTRPEAKTLLALCTSQPDRRDNLDLLIGHLRDEIERAGHSTHEIEINADASSIDDDLRVLLEEARHDDQLAGMLRQLAAFVRTHPVQPEHHLMAAEDPAPYGKSKRPAAESPSSPPSASALISEALKKEKSPDSTITSKTN